jgi:hypothetical protein
MYFADSLTPTNYMHRFCHRPLTVHSQKQNRKALNVLITCTWRGRSQVRMRNTPWLSKSNYIRFLRRLISSSARESGHPMELHIMRYITPAKAHASETVLVHGASSGVGIAALQITRAMGLMVLGTAGAPKGLGHRRHRT